MRKDFWITNTEEGRDYSNQFVTVTILKPTAFSDGEVIWLEEFIDKIRGYYPRMESPCRIEFDAHGAGFAQEVSKLSPDTVVIEDSAWDYYWFEIFKNGSEYEDYTMKMKSGRNTDEDEEYYFCDVTLNFGIAGREEQVVTGGGMVSSEDYEWLLEKLARHGKKRRKTQKTA